MNNNFPFNNLNTEQILERAKNTTLLCKELESLEKGKEFIDKQLELESEESRNKVTLVLSAYLIEKLSNQNNK